MLSGRCPESLLTDSQEKKRTLAEAAGASREAGLIDFRKSYTLYPSPFAKGRGKSFLKGALAPFKPLDERRSLKRQQGRVLEGSFAPLFSFSPLPLPREGAGERVLKTLQHLG